MSLESHSPVSFVMFPTAAKAFAVAEFLLILPKYSKTFDWFYTISTIVDNLMPNPVYIYAMDIYDL